MGCKGKSRPLLIDIIGAADIKTAAADIGMPLIDVDDMAVIGHIGLSLVRCQSIVGKIRCLYRPRCQDRAILTVSAGSERARNEAHNPDRHIGDSRQIKAAYVGFGGIGSCIYIILGLPLDVGAKSPGRQRIDGHHLTAVVDVSRSLIDGVAVIGKVMNTGCSLHSDIVCRAPDDTFKIRRPAGSFRDVACESRHIRTGYVDVEIENGNIPIGYDLTVDAEGLTVGQALDT